MQIEEAFTYCPRCSQKFTPHKGGFPTCSQCGLHFYINPKPCTSVLIFNEHSELLLVRRAIDPHKGLWDLPGGFIEIRESIIESGKREILEELSVEIEIDHIFDALPDIYEYQGIIYPTISTIMSAHIVSGILAPKDDVSEFEFTTIENALKKDFAFASIPTAIRISTT
jgi:ADP-ribose pyrophosphatase YjhB (NUDIX family)